MCHHYPGQKAGKIPPAFSELKVRWWDTLPLEPIEAYPMRQVAVLRMTTDDEWLLENRTWGFLPRLWKPTEKVNTASKFMRGKINARSETIHQTWPWKLAWRQRCLIIASGFCEPDQAGGEGLYTLHDHEYFLIPAVYDHYEGDDGQGNSITVDSCVMLTCDANALVADHRTGRMRQPVILTDVEDARRYCSQETVEYEHLADLLRPWPAEQMKHAHIPKHSNQKKLF